MDRYIEAVLKYGMIISLAVLLLGLTMYVLGPSGHEEVDLSLGEIAEGVLEGDVPDYLGFLELRRHSMAQKIKTWFAGL